MFRCQIVNFPNVHYLKKFRTRYLQVGHPGLFCKSLCQHTFAHAGRAIDKQPCGSRRIKALKCFWIFDDLDDRFETLFDLFVADDIIKADFRFNYFWFIFCFFACQV